MKTLPSAFMPNNRYSHDGAFMCLIACISFMPADTKHRSDCIPGPSYVLKLVLAVLKVTSER